MKICITGALGFIGSNLLNHCLELGLDVMGVDDLSNGHREFVPKSAFIHHYQLLDFTDRWVLKQIRDQRYDVCVHLAALPRVSYSVEHPLETQDVNVTKTLELLDACKGNIKRFVFASSSSVYGGADVLPTPETHPRNPKSPYALQKAHIEDYLKLYNELYGLDSACMRFFNVFGPNSVSGTAYATAISAWLNAIHRGQPMRSDGDGTQSRDLCYVDNVVDAVIRAAGHEGPLNTQCFNVACGEVTTNNDILAYLQERYPQATRLDAPVRAGDVKHTHADIRKAHEVLGYTPLVSASIGVERTCEWFERAWPWIKDLQCRL